MAQACSRLLCGYEYIVQYIMNNPHNCSIGPTEFKLYDGYANEWVKKIAIPAFLSAVFIFNTCRALSILYFEIIMNIIYLYIMVASVNSKYIYIYIGHTWLRTLVNEKYGNTGLYILIKAYYYHDVEFIYI